MPSSYNLNPDTFHSSVTLVSDGDEPKADNFNSPIKDCGDNTAYLEDKAFFGVEGYYPVRLGLPFENEQHAASDVWAPSVTIGAWVQVQNGAAGKLIFAAQTPIKGRITELWAEIAGAGGPGGVGHVPGGLPATKPTVSLYRVAYSEAGLTLVTTATDAPADATAYDAVHSFGSTGLTEDIGSTRSYLVHFTGEAGAGALVNELALYKIMLKIEATP